MRRFGVKLGAARLRESTDMARKFDRGDLHAEAETEIRKCILPCITRGENLTFDAAFAEATGNQDAGDMAELCISRGIVEQLGVDLEDLNAAIGGRCSVRHR